MLWGQKHESFERVMLVYFLVLVDLVTHIELDLGLSVKIDVRKDGYFFFVQRGFFLRCTMLYREVNCSRYIIVIKQD